ncbi:MAG: hypothetical protein WBC93_06315 [Sulfitobacter sp.]
MAIDLVRELRAQQQKRTLPRQHIPDLTARAADSIDRLRDELVACIASLRGDPSNVVGMKLRALNAEKTLADMEG